MAKWPMGHCLSFYSTDDRSPNVHAQFPEVSLKFRVSPILAIIFLAAFWPFGIAYGVVGTIFGVGLLGLSAALGLPITLS